MAVENYITYNGDLLCDATHSPSGAVLTTDAPGDLGGKDSTFSPTDLVAVGVASCVATVMGITADREGFDIKGTRITAAKELSTSGPLRITRIVASITLPEGKKPLSKQDREKLEAAARACPVKASLHPDLDVVMTFNYPEA